MRLSDIDADIARRSTLIAAIGSRGIGHRRAMRQQLSTQQTRRRCEAGVKGKAEAEPGPGASHKPAGVKKR